MSKLLQRLRDPAHSGVYRVRRPEALMHALAGGELELARVDLGMPVFEAFAQALAFPQWFGRNWDALEDCLTDLSWREAPGYLLLLHGGPDLEEKRRATLVAVLSATARFWAGQGKPFFAVFVDAEGKLALDELPSDP